MNPLILLDRHRPAHTRCGRLATSRPPAMAAAGTGAGPDLQNRRDIGLVMADLVAVPKWPALLAFFSILAIAGLSPPARGVTIDWVTVGDPGNEADAPAPNVCAHHNQS